MSKTPRQKPTPNKPLDACKSCGRVPKRQSFATNLELVEYKISGLCGSCQRRAESESIGRFN